MTTMTDTFLNQDLEQDDFSRFLEDRPCPLLYATVHGSRLYGFDTPSRDRDLRGCHVLPTRQVLGLHDGRETITSKGAASGAGVELVTHEVKKVLRLLLKGNSNVLEEALSPLVLVTGDFHAELRESAGECITGRHAGHYMGMASQVLSVLKKPDKADVKHVLHMYRAFLTGIHLMETGELECSLPALNARARLSHVDDLLRRRAVGPEERQVKEGEVGFLEEELDRLMLMLKDAADRSPLPARLGCGDRLNGLLVRIRRGGLYW